jgi:L-arabinokinase
VPVPLVARHAGRSRQQVRNILGITPATKAYLVSFTALDLSAEALRRIEQNRDLILLYRDPLVLRAANAHRVDNSDLSYADLVGAVDAVITKPGYGIVADCLAHGTPMIYSDRGDFPEYDILVRAMSRQLPVAYLPSTDLYAGRWEDALRILPEKRRTVPTITTDGNRVCAHMILEHICGH